MQQRPANSQNSHNHQNYLLGANQNMRKIILSLVLLVVFTITAFAQRETLEYGDETDLKGAKKIFVYTGKSLNIRNNIIKNIRKELKNLEFVSTENEAEIVLVFDEGFKDYFRGTKTTITTNTQVYENGTSNSTETITNQPEIEYHLQGEGMIIKKVNSFQERLILEFKDKKGFWLERNPSTNFAKTFVKAYKKANK